MPILIQISVQIPIQIAV